MGKPSAPEPPDPRETSAAQTGTSVATSLANAILQNPNQSTPYGSLTYDFGTGSGAVPGITTIAGTPGTPGQGGLPGGLDAGMFGQFAQGMGGTAGTPDRYSVGGQMFDSWKDANEYRNSLLAETGNYYTFTDPYTKQSYQIPIPTVTQTLTPEGQRLLDANMGTQQNLADLAQAQSGFLNEYMATPFQYTAGDHENWALGLYDQLSADQNAAMDEQLRTRLVNQGIAPGSEAYNREMEAMYGGRMNARNQFMLDSFGQGMSAAMANRNQPINEIIGLLSGSQVQSPNFVTPNIGGIPTTDNAGLINQNYNQRMAAWQQDMANRQSLMGGLFGLWASAISGGLF